MFYLKNDHCKFKFQIILMHYYEMSIYLVLFQYMYSPMHYTFNSVTIRIRQLPLNVPDILIPLDGALWTILLVTS